MIRTAPLVALLVSSLAAAAPATIKVFEATAHASADAQSPVLHTFVEGAQVSVSETAENGFRKIRLPDGKTGFIAESALNLAAVSADAPTTSAEKPVTTPRARVFVKDLKHLSELVASDLEVRPKADDLVQRETSANVALYGGMIGGSAVALGGFFLLPKSDCLDIGGQQSCGYGAEHFTALAIGSGLMIAGLVIYQVVKPDRKDVLDVLNLWNQRHPEEPFDATPVGPSSN